MAVPWAFAIPAVQRKRHVRLLSSTGGGARASCTLGRSASPRMDGPLTRQSPSRPCAMPKARCREDHRRRGRGLSI